MHLESKTESGTRQDSPQSYQVGPGSTRYIQTDFSSIYLHSSYYISDMVGFEEACFPATQRQTQPQLPPFSFQCGLTRSLRLSANNTAKLQILYIKRWIGCSLSKGAISEVSVTAEKVWKQGKKKRPLSLLPTGWRGWIAIVVAFKPSSQSQQQASMGQVWMIKW